MPAEGRITVLVPDERGMRALEPSPWLRPVLYAPGQDPDAGQRRATALVATVGPPDDADRLMSALPHLTLVQTLSAGFEPWIGRLPRGVALSNARGAHGRSTAEWVASVLLAHCRGLAGFARAQAAGRWEPRSTGSLEGRRVAVLGAGDIGSNVARMLAPFGCAVVLVGRTVREGVVPLASFRAAASGYDVVVLALPTSPETRGLVDAAFLAALGDGAILVNAGRGALVDTAALVAETASGRLSAILDVTDPEPLPPGHPLWEIPTVTITPHVAGDTEGAWDRAWTVAAAQLAMHARGETPTNLVIAAAPGPLTRDAGSHPRS